EGRWDIFDLKRVEEVDTTEWGLGFDEMGKCPKWLRFEVFSDSLFQTLCPRESDYRIESFGMTLARGSETIYEQIFYKDRLSDEDMRPFLVPAQKGDRLIIFPYAVSVFDGKGNCVSSQSCTAGVMFNLIVGEEE
ncbi:MAG: hypothetical protein AAF740_01710, partial [Bacteroidota bacterium]